FTLPADLHLPSDGSARWDVHRRRTQAAIAKVEEMRASNAADAENPYLAGLLDSDRARLDLMPHPATGPVPTSFARDILPLDRAAADAELGSDHVVRQAVGCIYSSSLQRLCSEHTAEFVHTTRSCRRRRNTRVRRPRPRRFRAAREVPAVYGTSSPRRHSPA